jgi:hypothetical protein
MKSSIAKGRWPEWFRQPSARQNAAKNRRFKLVLRRMLG